MNTEMNTQHPEAGAVLTVLTSTTFAHPWVEAAWTSDDYEPTVYRDDVLSYVIEAELVTSVMVECGALDSSDQVVLMDELTLAYDRLPRRRFQRLRRALSTMSFA